MWACWLGVLGEGIGGGMKIYEVKVTEVYLIEAPSEEQALMVYRDTKYFSLLRERQIIEVSEYKEVTE